MTSYNPEDKGYETIVISTCSRNKKSLQQLAEACVSLPSRNRHGCLSQEFQMNRLRGKVRDAGGVTTITVKVELSNINRSSKAKGENLQTGQVGVSCLNRLWFMYSYS